ncbi:hypothetical protein ACFLUO_05565 [Chloroflexota bacterium]
MGGPRISEEVRHSIAEVWYTSTFGGRKDIPGKELIYKAKEYLQKQRFISPKSSSSYYTVFAQMNNLPPDKKRLIDKFNRPWNLEILDEDDCSLPHDTIPIVLQLWRYCKNLGADLTIRQAKWASRLCYLLKDLDIAEQWIHIMRYSREEELSLLSGTQMRTDQLNSLLIMEPWECITLEETDVKFKANRKINHTVIPIGSDDGIVEEFLYAFADILQSRLDLMLEDKLADDYERVNKLSMLIHSLPSSSKYFPDLESRMVYLRHLAKLSKLPYCKTAKPEEIHSLIIELRAWIIAVMKHKIEKLNNPKPESLLGLRLDSGGPFPLDIYLRAGFSLEQDTEELFTELRKVHPDWWEKEGDK